MQLIDNPQGGYRFLTGIAPFWSDRYQRYAGSTRPGGRPGHDARSA
jgi:hypothetical protein